MELEITRGDIGATKAVFIRFFQRGLKADLLLGELMDVLPSVVTRADYAETEHSQVVSMLKSLNLEELRIECNQRGTRSNGPSAEPCAPPNVDPATSKSALGALSLLMGMAILVWCGYSLIVPNEQFRLRVGNLPGMSIPVFFIWFGWLWLRGERPTGKQFASELTLTLKLSDAAFGTGPERQGALDLKHRLEGVLEREGVGEIDGEEFGAGECSLFIRSNAPDRAEKVIRAFLAEESRALKYSLAHSEL